MASLPRLISAIALFVVNKGAHPQIWQSSWTRRTSAGLPDKSASRPTLDQAAFVLIFVVNAVLPVPNPLRTTSYYWVPVGLLDDAETIEVGAHLFTGSKASWETIPSDAPHFETVPKLSHLLELLSSQKR